MATQILKGTFAEVQQQLSKLHFKPEKRVRVILEDNEVPTETKRTKNGVRLFPRTDFTQVLTTEMISDLLDQAELEDYEYANSIA